MSPNFGKSIFDSTRKLLNIQKRVLKGRLNPFSVTPVSAIGSMSKRPDPQTRGHWKRHVYMAPAISPAYLLSRLDYFTFTPSPTEQHVDTQGMPLVVMLHGCTQDPYSFAQGTQMNVLAQKEGFVVLYPKQSKRYQMNNCWRWFVPDTHRGLAECETIVEIVKQTISMYGLDEKRVYIAGLSAGAAMAALVASKYPSLFKAVALHSGPVLGQAHSLASGLEAMQNDEHSQNLELTQGVEPFAIGQDNLPCMILHGKNDQVVHVSNAYKLVAQFLYMNKAPMSLEPSSSKRFIQTSREYTRKDYLYKGKRIVELILVKHLGHAWSGGDADIEYHSRNGPNASKMIWTFFKRQ